MKWCSVLAGSNRISQAIKAHDGQIFSLFMLKDKLISGGGRDRKVYVYDESYEVKISLEVWVIIILINIYLAQFINKY